MSLRVAFIGAGQMARNHVHAIERAKLPADIVGIHDPLAERAAELAALAGTHTYPSVRALLADARPDVVHVCTPPAAHFDTAYAALEAGAHVYVEKPFAQTADEASRLLDLADRERRLVCAGHQLLFDPAFTELVGRAGELGDPVQVDSHFAFRPSGAWLPRASARALAPLLVDILPHPLYSLIAVLERFGPTAAAVEIDWARGGPADLQAILRAGDIVGRLSVSLRARPVASSLTMTGTRGALTCDLVRTIVVGAANPGAEALEKVLNPMVEGMQLMVRTARSVGRRAVTGVSYPGLAELIGAFYTAIDGGGPSPIPPSHLLRVTAIFEELVQRIDAAIAPAANRAVVGGPAPALDSITTADPAPLVVVTGARGFLGSEVARALDRVRGIGRAVNRDDPHVHEWVVADLSRGVSPDALAGAEVVVHAAAETAGDFAAHQRNTIDATRHLLHAMHAAGVSRLVLVSSLSVLRPPRTPWERQNERTPRPEDPVRFGAYVWGKSLQEALVEREAPALGIAVRVIRPGALIDTDDPSLPGLMGRHLFGRWHLGLGRSRLPIAVCDVGRCAEAIAWCATHFDEAPPIVNLFEPDVTTRGAFLRRLRERGWTGRVVWVPISAISLAVIAARTAQAVLRGRMPVRLAAWSVLKPRRYDSHIAAKVLSACR
jgi:predicted dehydrogenase/nucleoside-diphosphate-sugar epimerase